jgi:hypothetical protein
MSEVRRLLNWFVLALLFGWVGLSIFGAFLGADLARELFNSPPMIVFWAVLALTLAAGVAVSLVRWRGPGLPGMHLGLLLILAGTMISSGPGQRLAARWTGCARMPWSYLRLEEGQTTSTVHDGSLLRELGSLPFSVRLDKFEVKYYPLAADPPALYFGTLEPEPGTLYFRWATRPLKWEPGRISGLPDTPIRFRVRDFTREAEGAAISATVELTGRGRTRVHKMVCPAADPFVRLALRPIFPDLTNFPESASLLLVRPVPPVRSYSSRVTFLEGAGEKPADIRVNHPARFSGYHIYQQAWDVDPKPHTVLLVVSDAGLNLVWAGFLLLGGGTVWRFWIRPCWSGGGEGGG